MFDNYTIIIIIFFRNILLIFLIILTLYKLINLKFPYIQSQIFDNTIYIIKIIFNYFLTIKNHMNEMNKIFYPTSLQCLRISIYSYFNKFLGIFIIFYFCNYITLLFFLTGFNLNLMRILVICSVFFYWSIILILDLRYKIPFINIYILNTDPILINKLKDNVYLCGLDPSGNPIRQNFIIKITNYLMYPPIRHNIARGMTYASTGFAICLSCSMFIWAFFSTHEIMYPERLPLLVEYRLIFDPPKDLETWTKLSQIHPQVKDTSAYQKFMNNPIEETVNIEDQNK